MKMYCVDLMRKSVVFQVNDLKDSNHSSIIHRSLCCAPAGCYGFMHSYTIRMHSNEQINHSTMWRVLLLNAKENVRGVNNWHFLGESGKPPRWLYDWLMNRGGKRGEVHWQTHHHWQKKEYECEWRTREEADLSSYGLENSKSGAWGLREKHGLWAGMCLSPPALDHRAELWGILCAGWRHIGTMKSAMVTVVAFATGIDKHYRSGLPPTEFKQDETALTVKQKQLCLPHGGGDGLFLFEWMNEQILDMGFPCPPE